MTVLTYLIIDTILTAVFILVARRNERMRNLLDHAFGLVIGTKYVTVHTVERERCNEFDHDGEPNYDADDED